MTVDDKDPAWIKENIKLKIKIKNILYKQYIQNRKFETDFMFLETFMTELNESLPAK